MKSLKNFQNSKLDSQEVSKIKGGSNDGELGIFCEWYVGYTGNKNMPAVDSATNPGVQTWSNM